MEINILKNQMPLLHPPQRTKAIGKVFEDLAAGYLENQGLTLLQKNFQCSLGEIDIIFLHDDTLVFVEVRYRKSHLYGGAAASIDYKKQRKLIRTAQVFLKSHVQMNKLPCRFDVIAVTLHDKMPHIDWIQNAFEAR